MMPAMSINYLAVLACAVVAMPVGSDEPRRVGTETLGPSC